MSYLPFVDGLRAVAILSVVVFHAFPDALPGGFTGVDVFFVISGFLITRMIAAEMACGRFSLWTFLVRRARRLMPASLVCLVATTALAGIVLLPDALLEYGKSLMAAALLYANVLFYKSAGYFAAPSHEKPLLHMWSLAVEDQFYLTWPLLLMVLAPRVSRGAVIVVAAALALASFAHAQAMVLSDPDWAFYLLPARAWQLLVGVLLALAIDRLRLGRAPAELLGLAGLAAIGGSFVVLDDGSDVPGASVLAVTLGAAAVILSGLHHPTYTARVLSWRPAVFVGLVSYSLYLWHWPLLALVRYQLERPLEPAEAALVVALSFAAAVLSWRYVERPFRAGGGRALWSDRRFVVAGVAAVLLLGGAGGVLKGLKGLPERYDGEVQKILTELGAGNPRRARCDGYARVFRNDDECNFGRRKEEAASYEVALLGDSMADHWAALVERYAERSGLAGRQATNGGCPPLLGAVIPEKPAKARECAAYQQELARFIEANPGLKVVFVSAYWTKWRQRLDGAAAAKDGASFEAVLDHTVARLLARGLKVHVIGQIPVYNELPVRCIVREVERRGDLSACGLPAQRMRAAVSGVEAAFARLAARHPGVSLSLPTAVMCGEHVCPPVRNGILLYKDHEHVNTFGALELASSFRLPWPH
jgi:peptidoglycan/LPS O-acetylase OafA/YrhL